MIYGSMDAVARKANLAQFRSRKVNVMIVTDVAARGIDIPLLDNSLNYDFPAKPKLFVHRAGRVARQGRIGTCFSFVGNDELPYLIDLHLFLGRPLRHRGDTGNGFSPAAAGPNSTDGADDALTERVPESCTLEGLLPEEVFYGRFPQTALDADMEAVRSRFETGMHSSNEDLGMLEKVALNAFQMYKRTRAEASRSSVKRAKLLDITSVHPLLNRLADSATGAGGDGGLADFKLSLSGYRPGLTVFEVDAAKAGKQPPEWMRAKRRMHNTKAIKKQRAAAEAAEMEAGEEESGDSDDQGEGEGDGAGAAGGSVAGARARAAVAAAVVAAVPSKPQGRRMSRAERKSMKKAGKGARAAPLGGASGPKQAPTYRDDDHYVDMSEPDAVTESALAVRSGDHGILGQAATFDVNPDDTTSMDAKRRMNVWDKKKKKYVQRTAADIQRGNKRSRTENGMATGAPSGERYRRWMTTSQRRIVSGGEETGDGSAKLDDAMGDWRGGFRRKGGGGAWAGADTNNDGDDGNVKSEVKTVEEIQKSRKVRCCYVLRTVWAV